MWESLREDPFSDVSRDPIEVVEDPTEHMKGPWPDVPCPEQHASVPTHFVAPPKSEVESLSTWEYLQVVWDFDSQHARVPWQDSPDVPASVHSCYKHMLDLEDQYGPWLQAKLGYWQTRNDALRQANPHWREAVAQDRPGVAAVLPPEYHPDVHRELLRAAGADPGVVDEILEGLLHQGTEFFNWFLRQSPLAFRAGKEEMDLELERSLHHGPSEVLRLLDRGNPGDGQQHVLDHTHKEQSMGKFEPDPGKEQWQIYKDAQATSSPMCHTTGTCLLSVSRVPSWERTTLRGTTGQ